jgi:hypothetical protein
VNLLPVEMMRRLLLEPLRNFGGRGKPRPYKDTFVIIGVITLLVSLLLLFDVVPFLRGGFGWQWPYQPAPVLRALPLLLLSIGYIVAVGWLLRLRRAAPLLLWSALAVILLPLAVILLRADDPLYSLFIRTVSAVTTGTHYAAADIDWAGGAWRDWSTLIHEMDGRIAHVPVSPPGLPMFYGLLNHLLSFAPASLTDAMQRALLPYQCHDYTYLAYSPAQWASAWFGILMPLWAALTVIPLHRIGRRLVGETGGRLAAAWFPLVPALLVFVPTWYMLFPLLSLLCFAVFEGALRRASRPRMLAAGVGFGGLVFINYAFIPLAALFGFYTLLYRWRGANVPHPQPLSHKERGEQGLRTGQSLRTSHHALRTRHPTGRLRTASSLRDVLGGAVIDGVWFGAGMCLPWLVYWLVSGQTFWDVFSASFDLHLDLDRPYLPWLWLHLWDWVLWLGVPVVLLWLAGLWRWRRRADAASPVLSLALLLTIVLLLLSAASRGETGRVWMIFTPFALIAAAAGAARRPPVRLLLSGQAALMLAVAITIAAIDAPDIEPPPPPPGAVMAQRAQAAHFEPAFTLVGWDASVEGAVLRLRLNWQTDAAMTTPYWFAALLVAPDGSTPLPAEVWQPRATRYPTTCWRPGEIVGDEIRLPLPDNAPSGDWWVSLSAFGDAVAAERLPVHLPDGARDTQVGLGPVRKTEKFAN